MYGGDLMPTSAEILLSRIRGGDCTVLGYGISNRPLVEWLVSHGARSVTVRDRRSAETMQEDGDIARLTSLGVTAVCGHTYLHDVGGDIIFRSPGIRPDHPAIRAAVEKGAILSSEMELFLALTPATVVGLSGSDGKTTSTTITAHILEAACRRRGHGRVYLGGNIGTPLLSLVEEMTPDDYAVVELSSFQLMTLPASVAPHRAALTNITPNHLNWHPDMAEYANAKYHILGGDHAALAVLNARDEYCRAVGKTLSLPVVWFSGEEDLPHGWLPDVFDAARGDQAVFEANGTIVLATAHGRVTPILPGEAIRLFGRHNVENYMTAIALTCTAADRAIPPADPADVADTAATFTGVRHRLELIREKDGVRFFNSSIDSSPSRTVAALHAMQEIDRREGNGRRSPIIICGGQDKQAPFAPLAEALCTYASTVVLTGEARDLIMDALVACPAFDPDRLPVMIIPDYREAMKAACDMALSIQNSPGETVLLSPACTSFDAFRNFEERGDTFRAIVEAL